MNSMRDETGGTTANGQVMNEDLVSGGTCAIGLTFLAAE